MALAGIAVDFLTKNAKGPAHAPFVYLYYVINAHGQSFVGSSIEGGGLIMCTCSSLYTRMVYINAAMSQ